MILAFIITVLPTLFFYLLFPQIGIYSKSQYLKVTFAWFAGMYFFTFTTFILAVFYSTFTSEDLLKATFTTLFLLTFAFFFIRKNLKGLLKVTTARLKNYSIITFPNLLLISLCLLFAYFFFAPHLVIENNTIYISPIYWDFHWHAQLIQNFAYGDNFPVQNEAFSGLPQTYHFFWGVFAAIYEVVGLNIADAINIVSILALFFIFMAIIGLSEEFFKTKWIGFIAIILTLTSSSGHALYYFASFPNQSFAETMHTILTTTQFPWLLSFIRGNPFGYQGIMFNDFYFLEERQMLFGIIYLLLCVWILFKRHTFTNKLLIWLGVAMGAYFLWHVYLTIMVLCAIIFLAIFGPDKKKSLFILGGFCSIFFAHVIFFKMIEHSPWFYQDIGNFPRLNFSFASGDNQVFSLKQALEYYSFGYGIKIIFFFVAAIYLWIKKRQHFLIFCAFIIPTFLLVNTIQLSPANISENHKWFRPMNVLVDIMTAYIVYYVFFRRDKLLLISLGLFSMFFLTISGVIELMPLLNSTPTQVYAEYPSVITVAIRQNTPPKSTFIGSDTTAIQLAGRKLFLGSPLGGDLQLKMNERRKIIDSIYEAKNIYTFCKITQQYGIDYVEVDALTYFLLKKQIETFSYFTAMDDYSIRKSFISVQTSCKVR